MKPIPIFSRTPTFTNPVLQPRTALRQSDWVNSPYAQAVAQQKQQQGGQQGGQQQSELPVIRPQTSITVGDIYSPRQTRAATNQAIAAQHAQADLRQAMKQFDRPGISRSAGSAAAALPTVVQANMGAAQAAVGIPLLDAIANAQHVLGAQTARENEAIGWGNLGMRLREGATRYDAQNQAAMLQPLLTILGMLGLE